MGLHHKLENEDGQVGSLEHGGESPMSTAGYLHAVGARRFPGVGCSYVPERGRCRPRPQRARPLNLSPAWRVPAGR